MQASEYDPHRFLKPCPRLTHATWRSAVHTQRSPPDDSCCITQFPERTHQITCSEFVRSAIYSPRLWRASPGSFAYIDVGVRNRANLPGIENDAFHKVLKNAGIKAKWAVSVPQCPVFDSLVREDNTMQSTYNSDRFRPSRFTNVFPIVSAALLLIFAESAFAFTVRVIDGDTGQPLPGFFVQVRPTATGRPFNDTDWIRHNLSGRTNQNGVWQVQFSNYPAWDAARHRVATVSVSQHAPLDLRNQYTDYEELAGSPPGRWSRMNYQQNDPLRVDFERIRPGLRGPARLGGYRDSDVVVVSVYRVGSGKWPHAGLTAKNHNGRMQIEHTRDASGKQITRLVPVTDDIDMDSDGDGLMDWEDPNPFGPVPDDFRRQQQRIVDQFNQQLAIPNRDGPASPSSSLVRRRTTYTFAPQQSIDKPNAEIRWPNNRVAVRASVRHMSVQRGGGLPGGYGLWLTLHVMNEQGSGRFQPGPDNLILVARPENGDAVIAVEQWHEIDAGDLTVRYRIDNLRWHPPQRIGWSGSFSGTILLETDLHVR